MWAGSARIGMTPARSLSKWSKEKWRTSDGKPAIRKGGTTRYLPEGSRRGKQFVSNTPKAKQARRRAMQLAGY
jgi:hypothetical protein